jgi:hypothetical protein
VSGPQHTSEGRAAAAASVMLPHQTKQEAVGDRHTHKPQHLSPRRARTCLVYEPARKKLGMGVAWSGLKGSMPGASRYRDCPILTMLCHVTCRPRALGNSWRTCAVVGVVAVCAHGAQRTRARWA